MHPEHRTIGELAYRLWQARGCPEGTAEKDWLDAEKQLRAVQPPASQRPDEPPANADAKWQAAGASRTEASRAEPSRAETTRVDVSRVEVTRADAPRPDAARAEPARTRAPARPRRTKSTQGKPSADPPS